MNMKRNPGSPHQMTVCIVVLAGFMSHALFGSSGVVSELNVPAGASVLRTVVTENWTLATSTGEVLVYSNATGNLVRRLKPPQPGAAIFAKHIAAAGDFVVVSNSYRSLSAFNCATGKHLWTTNMPYTWLVDSLATDGNRVAAADRGAMGPQSPIPAEGMVALFRADTGQWTVGDRSSAGQTTGLYGESIALSGPWMVVGMPGYDAPGMSNTGLVVIKHVNGTETFLEAPGKQNLELFGTSVAISGNTVYVGTTTRDRVYLFDIRTQAFIASIDKPSPSITGFGVSLTASGHLLIIQSDQGPWLYDRLTGSLTSIFPGIPVPQTARAIGLCGGYAATPSQGKLFRATNVGSSLGGGEVSTIGSNVAGAGVVKIAAFRDASLSAMGHAAFVAQLGGTGVNSANDISLWQGAAGSIELVMRESETYGSTKAGTAFSPCFSDDGGTTFMMSRSSTGSLSLWRRSGSTTASILMPGGYLTLPGGLTVAVARIHCAGAVQTSSSIANASLMTGSGVYADNDSLIVRPNLISPVEAREGSASGLPGALFAQLHPRLAVAGTRIAFSSFLMGRLPQVNAAVFTKTLAGVNVAALEKGSAPAGIISQFPDAVVTGFSGEAVSAAATLIRCTFKTARFSAEALMSYNHSTSARHAIAWVRGQVPGQAAGVTWRRFLKVFPSDNGGAFFLAQIGGPGITAVNDLGFWYCEPGSSSPKLLAGETSFLPGSGNAWIGTIQQVDASRDGTWTVLASLTRSPASRNQILIGGNVASDLGFEVIARKGISVDRPGASPLLGLGMPSNNVNAAGMSAVGNGRFAHDGRVLHFATYKEAKALTISEIWGY